MIERDLRKLQARPNKPGDTLPRTGRGAPALGQTERTPVTNADVQRSGNAVMKRTGAATLGLGADWQGMPGLHQEHRAYGETVVDLGQRQGDVVIDLSLANVFEMTTLGNTSFTFVMGDWPMQAYARSGNPRTGIDLPLTLMIDAQAGTLYFDVSVWAPRGVGPNLSLRGYYEIGFAYRYYPGEDTAKVRAYPIIVPPEPK